MQIRGSVSAPEIRNFLERQTIPLRLACRTPGGTLWMISLWFRCRDDDDEWALQCSTAANADVVSFLREDPAVAFEASTNEQPYRGVRGRGSVSIASDPEKAVLRDLLDRYLGGTDSSLARNLLREGRDEVTITIDPVVVSGWDYSGRMTDSGD